MISYNIMISLSLTRSSSHSPRQQRNKWRGYRSPYFDAENPSVFRDTTVHTRCILTCETNFNGGRGTKKNEGRKKLTKKFHINVPYLNLFRSCSYFCTSALSNLTFIRSVRNVHLQTECKPAPVVLQIS